MKRNPRISAVLFLFLPAVFIACPSPPRPEKNPVPVGRSAFFADLERDLADIAGDCKDNLNCYWEEGHDHIEFNACRGGALALFGSLTKCHKDSIAVLEDLIVELGFASKKTRRRRRSRRRRSRGGGGGSNDGGSGSILGALTRETFEAFCRLPTSRCGSLTYDDLTDNPPAGDDICLTKYDSIRSLLAPDADCSSFVQPSSGDGGGGGGGGGSPTPTPTPDPPSRNARIQTVTGVCPTANSQVHSIPDTNQLGRMVSTVIGGGDEVYYWKSSFIDSSGGTAKGSDSGSFTPDNDVVRAYHEDILGAMHIWLDGDLIPNFDKTKSWFAYRDSPAVAATLRHVDEYSAGGVNYHKFSLSSRITGGNSDIFLAYEDNGNCKYILPPSTN